jgi:hypothetical protein
MANEMLLQIANKALAELIQNGGQGDLAAILERAIQQQCAAMAPQLKAQVLAALKPQLAAVIGGSSFPDDEPCCDDCANGKSCATSCPQIPMMELPGCYGRCKKISKCLMQFMRTARSLIDTGAWLEYLKNDGPLVHLDVSVGAAPNYIAALPIGTGDSMIFMQEVAQVLPYEPGLIKIDAEWSGAKADGQVDVIFYTGPDTITANSVTSPSAAGLVQVGRKYKLSDFKCKDNCYLVAFPDAYGCSLGPVPYKRRVFVEFIAKALGASEITDLAVSIIKLGTPMFTQTCQDCGIVLG